MMVRVILSKTVVNWLLVSSILSGTDGKQFRFHLPWACSVLDEQGNLIGACTIFETDKVLVSVDNFNETAPGSNPPKLFYEKVPAGEVFVHAGSNYMNVDLVKPTPKFAQKIKATKLHVAFQPKSGREGWTIATNPAKISTEAGAEFDVFGLAFNVGILEIQDSFKYSPYIQPALFFETKQTEETEKISKRLQKEQIQRKTCVTYSWSRKLNRIRYHEVMYIKNDTCLDVFCKWKLTKCWKFPTKDYLKCFKSTKFADVCPTARGAALYCPKFDNTVFAILTTAPSCGLHNMPGVYTTISAVVRFVENTYQTQYAPAKRPRYDLYSLQQRNDDYEGIP